MNIFEYFRDDDKRVKAMASEIVEHYADWPQNWVFESVKKLIENLARFDKEELYPKVQECATEKDLSAMNKNFQTEMQR